MTTTEARYAEYADKEPTSLQAHMSEWIPEVTGVNPADFESPEDAFAEGVRLAVALRMEYQRSAENRERTAMEREEREEALEAQRKERAEARAKREEEAEAKRAKAEEDRKARLAEREQKQQEREQAQAAKKARVQDEDADEDEDEEEDEAPAKPVSKPVRKGRPGTKRPAAKAAKAGEDDPF